MVTTDNDRKVQKYTFDDNERVYVNGEKISGISIRKYDSGIVSVQTKKKRGVFSTGLNVMSTLVLYGSLVYTSFHWDDIIHQVFDKKIDGIDHIVQEEVPCDYLRENRKGNAVFECRTHEGQTSGEIAKIFNDYDLHLMSNSYAPISEESVVNAKGVPSKHLLMDK